MSEGPRGGKDSRLEKDPRSRGRQEAAGQGAAGAGPDSAGPGGAGPDGAGPAERPAVPGAAEPGVALDGSDTYALYRRGLDLLGRGSAAAAAQLLERAAAAEPESRSVLEALARAQFDAGRYTASAGRFRQIVEASPSDDYAQFGLGLALARAGDPRAAAEHLALAAAMRPDLRHYTDALRDVRATLRFRSRNEGQA